MKAQKSLFKRGYDRLELPDKNVEITLDSQQEEAVHTRSSMALVVAGAGSGKTRVLTERVKFLLSDGVSPHSIIAITFTNMAAEEMKERLSDVEGIGDVFIGTIHSFANKVMKLHSDKNYRIYNDDIDNDFHRELISKYCKSLTFDRYLEYKDIHNLVEIGKLPDSALQDVLLPSERAELDLIERSPSEIQCEIDLLGIDKVQFPESIKTLCKKRNVITFDQLLRMATDYFNSINATIGHVLVDELQDVGTLEFNFIESLQADNYFLVGDDWQCQPKGTKVTMSDGTLKNIEDIHVGDRVLSYDVSNGYYRRKTNKSFGCSVKDISVHTSDSLITIVTEKGKESSYTKNHRCFARIHYEGNEDKSVVYIMKNSKNQYRVGSTQLFTESGRNFGVRGRMNTERATEAWILDVFDTPREAWLCKQICSYKFGIPQMTWTFNNTRFTQEEADSLYHHLGDLTYSVSQCLNMYGRDINYPIFVKDTNKHFSKIHITEVHACNLIPYVMDVAVPILDSTGKYYNTYEQITHKVVIDNSVKVYGLKIDPTETYVADGILTHNSIYSFKGGNVNIFLKLIEDGMFNVYYLTNNYRNSQQVLEMSQQIISQVTKKIDKVITPVYNSEGNVTVMSKTKLPEVLRQISREENYKDWFLLVRTNKELYELAEKCAEYEVPYTTFKREGMSLSELRQRMNMNKVKVLTVHVSKGLEAKNVLLYGNFPIVCPNYRKDEEERKVMYVGVTRAIDNLYILN